MNPTFLNTYTMRGKELEANLRTRNRIQRKLVTHKQRREEHAKSERKLEREFARLVRDARECVPPMSTYEIGRLTGVSQSTVSRTATENGNP